MKSTRMGRGRLVVVSAAVMAAFALFISPAAYADKTDVVYLKNGGIVIGKVKGLQQGDFKVDTRAMGIVKIKWAYVDSILSTQLIQIEVGDGTRFLGTVGKGTGEKTITVSGGSGVDVLHLDDIVYLQPMVLVRHWWSGKK